MTKEKANQVLRDYEEFRQLVNITTLIDKGSPRVSTVGVCQAKQKEI